MRKRILKAQANELDFSREQISERAIEIAKMIVDGSYKNAVAGIGRMVVLSECITDNYWDEKLSFGKSLEEYYLKSEMREDHPDKKSDEEYRENEIKGLMYIECCTIEEAVEILDQKNK